MKTRDRFCYLISARLQSKKNLFILGFFLIAVAFPGVSQNYRPVRYFEYITNSNHYIFKRDTMQAQPVYCSLSKGNVSCNHLDSLDIFHNSRTDVVAALTTDSADIRVTYNGFSEKARKSFQFAVDIWKARIKSEVPIRIFATWRSLGDRTLGSAYSGDITGSGLYRDFPGALVEGTWYPVALAEKLGGTKINEDRDSEIVANFNSELAEWYYGIDGKCPEDKYDLASVVLHEIGHGLGFFATNDRDTVTNMNGFYGFYGYGTGYPCIFDRFIIDGNNRKIVDRNVFANPSKELLNLYTSNDVYFDGKQAVKANQGVLPKLYATSAYTPGSSVSHLDEFTYPKGDPNSLMGPIARKGESIHDPGPITLGIMEDIGWRSLRIFHTPLPDTENNLDSIIIKARIKSDDPLKRDSVLLFYSYDRLLTPAEVAVFQPTGVADEYQVTIANTTNGVVTYYIEAHDEAGHVSISPLKYPEEIFEFFVQKDVAKPFLFHQPIDQRLTGDTLPVTVYAVDNLGIRKVTVQYFINGIAQTDVPLEASKDTSLAYVYSGYFSQGLFKPGDSVRYRIAATDASSSANLSTYPEKGWFRFQVEHKLVPVSTYFNDFNKPTTDFVSQAGVFNVRTEPGFVNGAIHSAHPYKDGSRPFDFISDAIQFKYPVVLKAPTSVLTFDEVLLIQASAPGSDYRNADFKDYVLVEGSKDKGYSWRVLTNAYNTGANVDWYNAYNKNKDTQGNSIATGNSTLYRKRVVNLLLNQYFVGANPGTNTEIGDTIYIRFRLISDETLHGWGWAIDNFKLQTSPYEQGKDGNIKFVEDQLYLFPNPAKGETNILANSATEFDQMYIEVRNIFGNLMFDNDIKFAKTKSFTKILPLQNLGTGIYFISVKYGNQDLVRKLVVE